MIFYIIVVNYCQIITVKRDGPIHLLELSSCGYILYTINNIYLSLFDIFIKVDHNKTLTTATCLFRNILKRD